MAQPFGRFGSSNERDLAALRFALCRCRPSVNERRRLVTELQAKFRLSERHACQLLGQNRSTQRYLRVHHSVYSTTLHRLRVLRKAFPQSGYRMLWAQLKHEGFRISKAQVYKMCVDEGLLLNRSQPSAGRAVPPGEKTHRGRWKNHIWAMDLCTCRLENQTPISWLAAVDEFSRECVGMTVVDDRPTDAELLVILKKLFSKATKPLQLRVDNGFFKSAEEAKLAVFREAVLVQFTAPGKPWENGVIESFWARFHAEWLTGAQPESRATAIHLANDWSLYYNQHRFHSALDYQTPESFSASSPWWPTRG